MWDCVESGLFSSATSSWTHWLDLGISIDTQGVVHCKGLIVTHCNGSYASNSLITTPSNPLPALFPLLICLEIPLPLPQPAYCPGVQLMFLAPVPPRMPPPHRGKCCLPHHVVQGPRAGGSCMPVEAATWLCGDMNLVSGSNSQIPTPLWISYTIYKMSDY